MLSSIKRIAQGIATDYLLFVVSTISGLVLTPLILKVIGSAAFGLWATINSLLEYTKLLSLGLSPAATRYIAHYKARGDTQGVQFVFGTTFRICLSIALFTLFLNLILVAFLPQFLDLLPVQSFPGQAAFLIAGASFIVTLLTLPIQSLIFGHQQLHVLNAIRILSVFANGISVAALLYIGGGIVGLAVADLLTALLMSGLMWLYVQNALFDPGISLGRFSRKMLRDLLSFNVYLFLASLGARLIFSTDNIVIGVIQDVSSVTAYAIALRVINMGRSMIQYMTRVLIPVYSELHARRDVHQTAVAYSEATSLSLAMGAALFIIVSVFGRDFISLWVGPDSTIDQNTLWALSIILLVEGVVNPGIVMLLSVNRHREASLTLLVEGILNLMLSVALIHSLGTLGVALATLIGRGATTLWIIPRLSLETTNIPPIRYLRKIIAPPIVLAMATMIPTLAIHVCLSPRNPFALSGIAVFVLILYLAAYWILAVSRHQRRLFREIVSKALMTLLRVIRRPNLW
jgi:O-antigen/teichoic acid export membrane protein